MSGEEMAQEALVLVMDTGLPRLATLCAGLGWSEAAAAVLTLQSQLLPLVVPSVSRRRRRRSRKS